jgi:hypothetical protein
MTKLDWTRAGLSNPDPARVQDVGVQWPPDWANPAYRKMKAKRDPDLAYLAQITKFVEEIEQKDFFNTKAFRKKFNRHLRNRGQKEIQFYENASYKSVLRRMQLAVERFERSRY